MTNALNGRRILVTGGSGFLGNAVLRRLSSLGIDEVIAPTSADFDLRDRTATAAMFDTFEPEVVIHLAARVGGIGANQLRPAELYLDNLLMGTFVIDEARRHSTPKTVVVGTICSYPKITPVPFQETSLFEGYPEETNAPYGIAKLAQLVQLQSNRAQFAQNGIYLMPTNLYGPGDKFHPDVSHVIPALIRKCVQAAESGDEEIVVWGTGAASREFLYVDDAAAGIVAAAERYDGADPVNLGANAEMPIKELVDHIVAATGFEGRITWDTSKPDGQPRRRVDASRAAASFGFKAETAFPDGLARTVAWFRANRQEAESRDH